MSIRPPWLLPLLPLLALLAGCTPKVGNKCTLSTDCSQLGDRLCDTTQPDGYCTVFNCEPDACPDSICVAFDPTLDPACKTADDGKWPRFQRTFCLRPCNADGQEAELADLRRQLAESADPDTTSSVKTQISRTLQRDCRDQYQCVDLSDSGIQAARRAQVVDTGAADGGLGFAVCMPVSTCADGTQDFDETDVDCGGPACQKCAVDQKCQVDTDCASASCSGGRCQLGDAGVPAVCLPADAGFPVDGSAPWIPYDGGP